MSHVEDICREAMRLRKQNVERRTLRLVIGESVGREIIDLLYKYTEFGSDQLTKDGIAESFGPTSRFMDMPVRYDATLEGFRIEYDC
jgi:hypothetical protein